MIKSKLVKIAPICAIALLAVVSTGCANDPQASAEDLPLDQISVSCDEFSANHNISEEVQLTAGRSVTVVLCSNPTTGFQWGQAQVEDPAVAAETGHEFVELGNAENGEPLMGAAGQDVWTFKALKQGSTNISIDYSRPWEGGEKAEWTFNLTINVK
jgi:inhibitor of cysteine peptidase